MNEKLDAFKEALATVREKMQKLDAHLLGLQGSGLSEIQIRAQCVASGVLPSLNFHAYLNAKTEKEKIKCLVDAITAERNN